MNLKIEKDHQGKIFFKVGNLKFSNQGEAEHKINELERERERKRKKLKKLIQRKKWLVYQKKMIKKMKQKLRAEDFNSNKKGLSQND